MESLHGAIAEAGCDDFLVGPFSLLERVLGQLLRRGDLSRVLEIIDHFCSDARCAVWLEESAWQLLDRGETGAVERLLNRCPLETLNKNAMLLAIRAWTCGFLGNQREAAHYSRKAVTARPGAGSMTDAAGLMGYLAFVAFQGFDAAQGMKESYAGEEVVTPLDFLAAVIDLLSEVEVARLLLVRSWGYDRELEHKREKPNAQRLSALIALYAKYAERFSDTPEGRLAIHALQFIDSPELRQHMQDLGCAVVALVRRRGLRSMTEALVVGDLWRNGFFGVAGRSADVRDTRVLGEAATLLSRIGRDANGEPIPVPWEAGSLRRSAPKSGSGLVLPGFERAQTVAERVPPCSVRLFGNFEVTIGERLVPENAWRHKCSLMFQIMALAQGRDLNRDIVLRELWPSFSRPRALDNFYGVWSRTAATLGSAAYIDRIGDFIRVNSTYVSSDVAEFEQLIRRLLTERDDASVLLDIYARLEALYRGGLLPGEVGCKTIDSQRVRYREMYVDAMAAASSKALEVHDARVALWFARMAMAEDASREDVYYAMIRAQVAAGQRCSAIRTYFDCREYLRSELGLDPSLETQKLYDELVTIDPSLLRLEPATFRK